MADFNPFQDVLEWLRERYMATPSISIPIETQPEIVVEEPVPLHPAPDIPIPDIKCEVIG